MNKTKTNLYLNDGIVMTEIAGWCTGLQSLLSFSQCNKTGCKWITMPTHWKSNQRVSQGKEMGCSSVAKSDNWPQTDRAHCSLKAERTTNKQQMTVAAIKPWQSIPREERLNLVMSMVYSPKGVIFCKGFLTNHSNPHNPYIKHVQLLLKHLKWGTIKWLKCLNS